MKYLNLLLIIILVNCSCKDEFMDRYPPDAISDANFWQRASDIKMYANQFYQDLAIPDRAFAADNSTDNQAPSVRGAYVWDETPVPSSGGGWAKSDWYKIRSCNYALARIEQMPKTTETLMYEGEIRFFKSFFYFNKLKAFGEVPWLDKDLQTNSEELFAPKDSREVVVTNILKDLDFAIDYLPETSADDRLTKYAAYALKAEISLYEGTFRKYHDTGGDYEGLLRVSVSASEAVINSGRFNVYSTGNPHSDFFDLFVQHELKGNPEGIMIERFIMDIRTHNNVRWLSEPVTGYTKDFAESFLCADGLPISLSPLYKGDKIFDDEFAGRDPRMRQSIYTADRPFRIFDNGTTLDKILPEFNAQICPTSYFITKGFSPYERDREKERCDIDIFIFRYGKLLLDYAEAKAELGECTQEVLDQSVNRLRDRVAMPHLKVNVGFIDTEWPDWEVPVSPLLNEIRRERRIELSGEGRRWDDLVRWKAGKLLENRKTLLGAYDPGSDNYREIYPGRSRIWANKLYLRPLPLEDLVLNPNLTQNPGW